jgi:hypothetical protein
LIVGIFIMGAAIWAIGLIAPLLILGGLAFAFLGVFGPEHVARWTGTDSPRLIAIGGGVGTVVVALLCGNAVYGELLSRPTPTPLVAAYTYQMPTFAAATATPWTAPWPTATPYAPSSTTPSASPTPTAPPTRLVAVIGQTGICQLLLSADFLDVSPGSGYFPLSDRSGFAALDVLDTDGGENAFADAATRRVEELREVVAGYTVTDVQPSASALRLAYSGSVEGNAGRGVLHIAQFGRTVCSVTLFALPDSPLALDVTLGEMTVSLRLAAPITMEPFTPSAAPASGLVRDEGCGSRGGPGFRLPNGKCASWEDVYGSTGSGSSGGGGGGSSGGCGSRGGPGGPRTKSGKCPSWPR